MKKMTKIVLIVLAPVTLALIIAAIVTLSAVSGYSLLYMDSGLGSFCAASYRWFCLFSILLIIFWIVITVKYRHNIVALFKKIGGSIKVNAAPAQAYPAGAVSTPAPVQPAPVAPVQPIPTVPVQPAPVAPVQPIPTVPVQPAPVAPVQPIPAAPVQPVSTFTPNQTVSDTSVPISPTNYQQEINTIPPTPNHAVAFCRKCGKPVSPTDRFCHFCGNPIL